MPVCGETPCVTHLVSPTYHFIAMQLYNYASEARALFEMY
jgi:hypothetical protein